MKLWLFITVVLLCLSALNLDGGKSIRKIGCRGRTSGRGYCFNSSEGEFTVRVILYRNLKDGLQKLGWWKEYKKNRLSWPNIWTWLLLQLFGGGVYGESYLIQKPEEWLANLVS